MWLPLAILSYSLFAVSSLADRYLLAGPLPKPLVYTFYAGITGGLAILLVPFGFAFPSLAISLLALGAGAVGVAGLLSLYHTTYAGTVSRVVPLMGAFLPFITLTLLEGTEAGGELFLPQTLQALAVLAAAAVFLSADAERFFPRVKDFAHALTAAFLFSVAFVGAKMVYEDIGFLNGFIWMRGGSFLAALFLLALPAVRMTVFAHNPLGKRRVYVPLLAGKGSGACAFLFQQLAIYFAPLAKLAFINALHGVQYAFLLFFVAIIGMRNPRILREELTPRSFALRLIGVALLVAGLFILMAG